MKEQTTKTIIELSSLLADAEVYAGKIDFCTTNLMELVELCEYDQAEENERPFYFWNNRERIEKFVEMQKDYYHDKVLPLLEQAQEQIQLLLDQQKEQESKGK